MRKVFLVTGLISIYVLTSCEGDISAEGGTKKTIDFEKFTLDTPLDWNRFYPKFTDGFFGGLTNKKDTLFFDYGIFAFSSIDDIKNTDETIILQELKIDSYDSKIVKQKRTNENRIFLGLYTDKRDNVNRNSVYTYTAKDQEVIMGIFLSHKFK